jgi:hypothetical protein
MKIIIIALFQLIEMCMLVKVVIVIRILKITEPLNARDYYKYCIYILMGTSSRCFLS